MLELWQTEWCPASRRIRQRLTELDLDYITRQVLVEKARRETLRKATRTDTIPTLVDERGTVLVGEDEIRTFLDSEIVEPAGADAHRLKGANARRLYLEEECECLQPATP